MNIVYAASHRRRELGKDDIHFSEAEMLERSMFGQTGVYTDGDGIVYRIGELDNKARDAVRKRYTMEQAARTKEVMEELCTLKGVKELPDDCCSLLKAADFIDGGHAPRKEDAVWHISYYSEQDKERIETVMKRAGCRKYVLYHGIDDCIAEFKIG